MMPMPMNTLDQMRIAVHLPLAAALATNTARMGDGFVCLDDVHVAKLSADAKAILTTTWPEEERRTGEIFVGHVFLKDPPRRLEVESVDVAHVLEQLERVAASARERRDREAADRARVEAAAPRLEAEARAWLIEHGDELPEGDDYAFHRAAREGRLVRASLTACLDRVLTGLIEGDGRLQPRWLARAYGEPLHRPDVPSRDAYLLAAGVGAALPDLQKASLLPGGVWAVSPISRLNLSPPRKKPQYRTGLRVTFSHPWLAWTLEHNRHELQWNLLAEAPPKAAEGTGTPDE